MARSIRLCILSSMLLIKLTFNPRYENSLTLQNYTIWSQGSDLFYFSVLHFLIPPYILFWTHLLGNQILWQICQIWLLLCNACYGKTWTGYTWGIQKPLWSFTTCIIRTWPIILIFITFHVALDRKIVEQWIWKDAEGRWHNVKQSHMYI